MSSVRARLLASRPEALAYARTLARIPADLSRVEGRVGGITVYPVKGLGGLHVERARIDRIGLVDPATGLADRGVMLAALRAGVDPKGGPYDAIGVSNRIEGALSLVTARRDGAKLVYEAPGLPPLRLDPAALAPRAGPTTRVWLYEGGPIVEGVRDEGELALWVRALLKEHVLPRRFDPEDVVAILPAEGVVRPVAEKHRAGEDALTGFGDGGHALVASSSTLAWMNDALRASGAREIEMAAFRPNVVLDDLPANVEDLVAEAEFEGSDGAARLVFATMCVRCDATRVDPRTGRRPDAQPLAFLARERPPRGDSANSATFAVNAVARGSAHGRTIARGDRVRLLRERE